MCRSGHYQEHGILRLDGFMTSDVLIEAGRLVRVPTQLGEAAVLAEPLCIGEKAIEVLRRVQSRVDHPCSHPEHAWDKPAWGGCKTALVAGLGPVGLLMALKLRLEGVETWMLGIHSASEARVAWARALGARYLDLREVGWDRVANEMPSPDLVIEMTGSADVAMQLPSLLGPNGCLVLVGFPGGRGSFMLDHYQLTRRLVLQNQAIVGVINGKRRHLEQAMADLVRAEQYIPGLLSRLITHRYPLDDFQAAFALPRSDAVKVILKPD
jgi:threonine dehydrogenase-like Zn-dependent dehydrogenase